MGVDYFQQTITVCNSKDTFRYTTPLVRHVSVTFRLAAEKRFRRWSQFGEVWFNISTLVTLVTLCNNWQTAASWVFDPSIHHDLLTTRTLSLFVMPLCFAPFINGQWLICDRRWEFWLNSARSFSSLDWDQNSSPFIWSVMVRFTGTGCGASSDDEAIASDDHLEPKQGSADVTNSSKPPFKPPGTSFCNISRQIITLKQFDETFTLNFNGHNRTEVRLV